MKAAYVSVSAAGLHWEIRDAAVPQPAATQLLVRVSASSLNRGERTLLDEQRAAAGSKPVPPRIGGIDAAGEIVAIGNAVNGFRTGERVAGRCAGGYAEFALLNAPEAMRIPDALNAAEAACLPVSYTVAHDSLVVHGHIAAGETVLIAGAASAVGVASLQITKHHGAKTIGTSGSLDKLARLKTAGLDAGLHTRSGDFAEAVLQATGGKGADIVIDTLGPSIFNAILQCMAVDGCMATIGRMAGPAKVDLDLDFFAMRRFNLFGVSNRMRTSAQRALTVQLFVDDFMPALAKGAFKPMIDRSFALQDVAQAHDYQSQDRHVGKIVLTV